MLPGRPGGTYFMSLLLQGTSDDQQGKPPVRAGLAADSQRLTRTYI
jgi:hypothetical protein